MWLISVATFHKSKYSHFRQLPLFGMSLGIKSHFQPLSMKSNKNREKITHSTNRTSPSRNPSHTRMTIFKPLAKTMNFSASHHPLVPRPHHLNPVWQRHDSSSYVTESAHSLSVIPDQ